VAKFPETATHAIDFGPGGLRGIGPLTARNLDGHGIRVVIVGDGGKGDAELYDSQNIQYKEWRGKKWGPKLVWRLGMQQVLCYSDQALIACSDNCEVGSAVGGGVPTLGFRVPNLRQQEDRNSMSTLSISPSEYRSVRSSPSLSSLDERDHRDRERERDPRDI
jgi:hypothetical protein